MTSPTGSKLISASNAEPPQTKHDARTAQETVRRAGFTLIELILVMTMLVIVLAVVAPSLSRFFRGRTLDSEAKRFLALTRYGQSRAVSESVPMVLWIDPDRRAYGLEADSTYVEQDSQHREYQWDTEIEVKVEQSTSARKLSAVWKGNGAFANHVQKIRFTPDGFIADTSPELVLFRGRDEGEIYVGEHQSRQKYEIQTNQVQRLWR